MKIKQIKTLLKKAIIEKEPDILDSITQIPILKKEVFEMNTKNEKKRSKKVIIIPVVASIAICCFALFTFVVIPSQEETLLSLDVNPSIELVLNKGEKVVKCVPKNDDAKKIVGDMKLKNLEAETALNAIIGSLFQKGYLAKDTKENDILLSVNNKDKTKTTDLETKYTKVLKTTLHENHVSGTILTQKDVVNDNTKKIARDHEISVGKASLIEKIMNKSPNSNVSELTAMNVKDLVRYMDTNNLELDDVTSEDTDDDYDDILDKQEELKEDNKDKLNEQQEKEQDKIKDEKEITEEKIKKEEEKLKEQKDKEQEKLKEQQEKEQERIKKEQEKLKEQQEREQERIKQEQDKLKEQKEKEQEKLKEQQEKLNEKQEQEGEE